MQDFRQKEKSARLVHSVQPEEGDFIFLEIELSDVSEFSEELLESVRLRRERHQSAALRQPGHSQRHRGDSFETSRDRTGKIPCMFTLLAGQKDIR